MSRRFILLLTAMFALFFHSCDPNRVYEKNIRIPEGIWSHDNIVKFDVMVEDTSSSHNNYCS